MQITGQEKPNNNVFILAGQQWAVGTGGGRAGQESRPREPASHLDLTTHCDIAASDVLCVSNVHPFNSRRHIYATAAAAAVMKKPRARSSKTRLKRIITILALNSQEVEECMLVCVCDKTIHYL